MSEFIPFPKVPRLCRDMVITEKIDGTNASVWIGTEFQDAEVETYISRIFVPHMAETYTVRAASRTRFIKPGKCTDNFGFAAWVEEHAFELAEGLGEGVHHGEWWGGKIQRGYGRTHKTFSLFNTGKWCDGQQPTVAPDTVTAPPGCCRVVPVLYRGPFGTEGWLDAFQQLGRWGSVAAPGFKDPEGIMIFHEGARQLFKKTFKDDAAGKGG